MNKMRIRQFIDEVYFLGEQKEYKGFLGNIKNVLKVREAKEVLKKKRKAYDFTLANLFIKYGIENEELYDELDKLWGEIKETPIMVKLLMGVLNPTNIMISLIELQSVFNVYIKKTREYCEKYIMEQENE